MLEVLKLQLSCCTHTHKTDEADQICEEFSGIMITFDVKAFCCAEDDKLPEEERLYIHVH